MSNNLVKRLMDPLAKAKKALDESSAGPRLAAALRGGNRDGSTSGAEGEALNGAHGGIRRQLGARPAPNGHDAAAEPKPARPAPAGNGTEAVDATAPAQRPVGPRVRDAAVAVPARPMRPQAPPAEGGGNGVPSVAEAMRDLQVDDGDDGHAAPDEPRIKLITSYDAEAGVHVVDTSREAMQRLRERLARCGELLTGPGGVYERRPELRDVLALFADGLFLVSRSHVDDPHVSSFEGLLRRKGMRVEKVAVEMSIIREVYEGAIDNRAAARAEAQSSTMQRDILRFIGDVTRFKTSDAHIVVSRDRAEVRIRVDGVMRPYQEWRASYGADFCAAIFAMADASDASYQPYEYQAARVSDSTVRMPKGVQAIRLQFNPLAYGGRHLVMRFLYRGSEEIRDVDTLGYSEQQVAYLQKMRALPMGINIIAGPTGSGKSTTLQRSLSTLLYQRNYECSVFTVEDPPEYAIKGAQQMPVTNASTNEERAQKFNQAIRAALRSDPDVIMIGEVRDKESAKLAFEAAMTGHQVWTTLHATDAITILSRLKDIGIEPYKLYDPGVLTGLVCQRLTRTLCPNCSIPAEHADADHLDPALRERLLPALLGDLSGVRVPGPGCETCKGTGVTGRTVVAECILPDMDFMTYMMRDDRAQGLSYWMRQEGSLSMMLHGLAKVRAGRLAPQELERVLGPIEPHHRIDKSNFALSGQKH